MERPDGSRFAWMPSAAPTPRRGVDPTDVQRRSDDRLSCMVSATKCRGFRPLRATDGWVGVAACLRREDHAVASESRRESAPVRLGQARCCSGRRAPPAAGDCVSVYRVGWLTVALSLAVVGLGAAMVLLKVALLILIPFALVGVLVATLFVTNSGDSRTVEALLLPCVSDGRALGRSGRRRRGVRRSGRAHRVTGGRLDGGHVARRAPRLPTRTGFGSPPDEPRSLTPWLVPWRTRTRCSSRSG